MQLLCTMAQKENCKNCVFKYLADQNRPYSVNDIIQNLHNEFSRSAVQKALDELSFENKIREKIYGKQKVYSFTNTDENHLSNTALEINELDLKIEKTLLKLNALEQELKLTEHELNFIKTQPTTSSAFQQISDLGELNKKLNEQVKNLSESKLEIMQKEKSELSILNNKFSEEYKKRKHLCMDIIHSILENYPKKKKYLLEEIGIEMDDENS